VTLVVVVALGGSLRRLSSSVQVTRYRVAAQRESEHDGQLADTGEGDHAPALEGAIEGVVVYPTIHGFVDRPVWSTGPGRACTSGFLRVAAAKNDYEVASLSLTR
jgi:hypothetical protein